MNNTYLNENEKDLIIAFNSNPKMVEAVKKVLLHTIYNQGVIRSGETPENTNWVFGILNGTERTNDEVAEKLMASLKGLSYLESGFKRLEEFVPVDEPKKKGNPAI